jgi:hypothetical protein
MTVVGCISQSFGLGLVVCVAVACAAEQDAERRRGSDLTGSGGVGGTAGFAAGAPLAGGGAVGGQGGSGGSVEVPIDDGSGMNCGATSQAAQQVVMETTVEVEVEVEEAKPVAIYLLQDRSGSMANWDVGAGVSLWDLAKQSVSALMSDPASAGIDIALEYFPQDGHACDGAGYEVPAVDLGRLPGHAAAITGSLNGGGPYGGSTPIAGALTGGTQYCTEFQAAQPDEKCIVLLLTDGDPDTDDECNDDIAHAAGIAAAGFDAGVLTYAIGMGGAAIANLNMIASAGGTDCDAASANTACNATTGGSAALAAALDAVRDKVVTVETHTEVQQVVQQIPLDCEWDLPSPSAGSVFDKDRVNVRFTAAPNSTPSDFGRVAAATDCGTHADAWHYDDLANPSRILACPGACTNIKAAPAGTIDILLDCPTIVVE